jgi:hypothetical protein
MENTNEKLQEYYEILVQNQQKGEIYKIKFRNETQTFTGIPMISHRIQQSNDSSFVFNILSPEEHKGIYERSLREIESLEK